MHATIRESSTLHDRVADIRRTGRGLTALRERYIRRAEYLCMDTWFRERIRRARNEWQEQYPLFSIGDGPVISYKKYPWVRMREMTYETWFQTYLRMKPRGLTFEEVVTDLINMLAAIEHESFPIHDFYSTALIKTQRGAEFILACMQNDPRTILGNTGLYFPLDQLELKMDLRQYEEYGIEPEDWELAHVSQNWYIPVYPGMTEKDLRDAIPGIIKQVQEVLGPRTVGARIEALQDDGLTQQAIADCLGLNVKAVQAHLRSCRKAA